MGIPTAATIRARDPCATASLGMEIRANREAYGIPAKELHRSSDEMHRRIERSAMPTGARISTSLNAILPGLSCGFYAARARSAFVTAHKRASCPQIESRFTRFATAFVGSSEGYPVQATPVVGRVVPWFRRTPRIVACRPQTVGNLHRRVSNPTYQGSSLQSSEKSLGVSAR